VLVLVFVFVLRGLLPLTFTCKCLGVTSLNHIATL